MNTSGGPAASLRDFFKAPIERIIVVHDELDLEPGALRLKQGGGDNGHNGLKSLRQSLGSGEFYRVRLGHRPAARPPGPGRLRPARLHRRRAQGARRPARARGRRDRAAGG